MVRVLCIYKDHLCSKKMVFDVGMAGKVSLNVTVRVYRAI